MFGMLETSSIKPLLRISTIMPSPEPIYAAANVEFAYQLRWAMTMFIDGTLPPIGSLAPIEKALEADGIRVLSRRYAPPNMLQLILSTQPHLAPATIVQRTKGRLCYGWKAFANVSAKKQYALRSYGTQEREIIEAYIAGQSAHHPMATDRANELFDELSFSDPEVHLENPIKIERSLIWFNLHIVLVHAERWRTVNRDLLLRVQTMVQSVCKKYQWRLSRCGILAYHLHIALGANVGDSVEDVVLRLMNNLAFVHRMKAVYQFSAYVGTFGEYDQRAIQSK